jgi:hypothetical protein
MLISELANRATRKGRFCRWDSSFRLRDWHHVLHERMDGFLGGPSRIFIGRRAASRIGACAASLRRSKRRATYVRHSTRDRLWIRDVGLVRVGSRLGSDGQAGCVSCTHSDGVSSNLGRYAEILRSQGGRNRVTSAGW